MKRDCRGTADRQRGALLIAVLIALAALTLLGAAALEAVLLEERMAGNVNSRQSVLAAADHALDEVERQLQNAVLADDQAWLDAALDGQSLLLPDWLAEVRYRIVFCCDTAWDTALPLNEDNVARLYRIELEALSGEKRARTALQSTYLVSLDSPRGRRATWWSRDPAF
jgi:Tfp pilus assembly protein PilX